MIRYGESELVIIHAAETSDDEEYIRAVLGAFTDIMSKRAFPCALTRAL